MLFVPKKNGRWWMCSNYWALNKQTVKDRYPLPPIDLLLDRLGQAKVFSKLDLAQGYHQIAMVADSVEKKAFCTSIGQWEYLVMPFGLCNAPSTFQRLMNTVFEKELNSFILAGTDSPRATSSPMEVEPDQGIKLTRGKSMYVVGVSIEPLQRRSRRVGGGCVRMHQMRTFGLPFRSS